MNTHQLFPLHKQVKKTCLDLTSPLPENELNELVPDVNELIILSEFVFYIETNDIILENVCNCCWNRFVIKLRLLQKKSKNFVRNLLKFTKKCPKLICLKINCPKYFCPKFFDVNVCIQYITP